MKMPAHVTPKTTLSQLAAIISRCTAIISNDSGPMHISASLGIPTLGIFGPTNPRQQGPYGSNHRWVRNEELDCLECSLTACPIGNICMTQLKVERVMDAFSLLVSQSEQNMQPAANHSKDV
jgi:ADP-heptose:LPS heptosyltransferase